MRVWLLLNRASRAVKDDWEVLLTAAIAARGWTIAGTTDFPNEDAPEQTALADVDMLAVAAGDGTINAIARQLDSWPGMLLVLPGGTMNLLAKALHDATDPAAIIAALSESPQARTLSTIECGPDRALVGVIVGPGASWVHAREAVRHGRWARLRRAVQLAWQRSTRRTVHLRNGTARSKGYRAIFIQPAADALSVVSVSASGWADYVRLGLTYAGGQWQNARGIDSTTTTAVALAEYRPTFALFDGEPLHLAPDAVLRAGWTQLKFITTT
jgi:diacylglycerol kinase family enzyme